jgi:hypothetical protein
MRYLINFGQRCRANRKKKADVLKVLSKVTVE